MPNQTFPTQPYKGTRDFYPDSNQFVNSQKYTSLFLYQKYIFDTWRQVLVDAGFVEYDASIIEQAELYLAKSGKELGSKQLYNFRDKSDRHIALRPEMTPTLARMVADKYGELKFPLRWFSIPNCFRYEAPQKGRTREHWQVNVDIIGLAAGASDVELFLIAPKLFSAFGANKDQFAIYYNDRRVMDWFLGDYLQIQENKEEVVKIIDDYRKFSPEQNREFFRKYLNDQKIDKIIDLCSDKNSQSYQFYFQKAEQNPEIKTLNQLVKNIYPDFNIAFDPAIIRGQAYYTGIVFEAFDKNKENPRSLMGGGRYDNLMELFNKPKTPCVGLGSGDVTWLEFLKNWNLLDGSPAFETWKKQNQKEKVGIVLDKTPFATFGLEYLKKFGIKQNLDNQTLDTQNTFQNQYPFFENTSKENSILDNSLNPNQSSEISLAPLRIRSVALIKLSGTDKFICFKKTKPSKQEFYSDPNMLFLAGGKLENNENPTQAAIREVSEEIGLSGLNFVKKIATCLKYLPYQNSLSQSLEYYLLFEIDQDSLDNRDKNSELDQKSWEISLATLEELEGNNWDQLNWVVEILQKEGLADDSLAEKNLNFDLNFQSLDKNSSDALEKGQKQEIPIQKIGFLYQTLIPDLKSQSLVCDIDYNIDRSTKKRAENLRKRGCSGIIKL